MSAPRVLAASCSMCFGISPAPPEWITSMAGGTGGLIHNCRTGSSARRRAATSSSAPSRRLFSTSTLSGELAMRNARSASAAVETWQVVVVARSEFHAEARANSRSSKRRSCVVCRACWNHSLLSSRSASRSTTVCAASSARKISRSRNGSATRSFQTATVSSPFGISIVNRINAP